MRKFISNLFTLIAIVSIGFALTEVFKRAEFNPIDLAIISYASLLVSAAFTIPRKVSNG
jgi:hypothetical protein